MPLQVIYFGTPGSGKSYQVKMKLAGVDEDNIFRTTFHPDSDYASFVGCYKPMTVPTRTALSKQALLDKLLEYQQSGKTYALHRFCAAYPEVGNLSRCEREELLADAKVQESMATEIYKALACADELKPYMDCTDITYEFTPQVFTNAYVRAWQKNSDTTEHNRDVYLLIEEINRGNCAQIFGDLFQLLDRDSNGYSEYKIKADKDLAVYLQQVLGIGHEGIKGGNLCLPNNLHIIATMNTSDQSLFPMDSAFKRRWDWEYVPIRYSREISSGKFTISIDSAEYLWVDFLEKVNERILEVTDSEDKQMGNFFIKHSIEEREFKSKVMFYLWHEVCKDEFHTKNNFFRHQVDGKETEFSFNDLYSSEERSILSGFMQYLGVKVIMNESSASVEVEMGDPK